MDDYPGGWFGESWGAPVCEEARHRPTPVGKPCPECLFEIEATDQGILTPYAGPPPEMLAYHLVCFLRTVVPCEMWTDEMKQNMPPRWAEHMATHHRRK